MVCESITIPKNTGQIFIYKTLSQTNQARQSKFDLQNVFFLNISLISKQLRL